LEKKTTLAPIENALNAPCQKKLGTGDQAEAGEAGFHCTKRAERMVKGRLPTEGD